MMLNISMMDLLFNFYFNLILLDNKLPEGWTNIPNWYNCIMKMYLMTYNLDLITLWMYLGLGWIIQMEKMCKSSTILTEQNGQFLQWGHRTNRTCIRLYGMLVCKTWEVWLGEVFTKYPNCDCSGVVSMSTSPTTHTCQLSQPGAVPLYTGSKWASVTYLHINSILYVCNHVDFW